jgi:protein-L-isoaspartate(D-aspartate) O-methyltransferase
MPADQEGLARLIMREGIGARVAEAFRKIDRAHFVPEGSELEAYVDRPVAIPEKQTTSQPSLIARMIDAAAVQPDDRVLEIGTGYGFQTALMAVLAKEVVSIERSPRLAERARSNLERAGLHNVEMHSADGWKGWPDRAPYAAIVVSAAADRMPEALVEQLDERGRLVIPLKHRGSDDVILFERRKGKLVELGLLTPARFVPLVRGEPE